MKFLWIYVVSLYVKFYVKIGQKFRKNKIRQFNKRILLLSFLIIIMHLYYTLKVSKL